MTRRPPEINADLQVILKGKRLSPQKVPLSSLGKLLATLNKLGADKKRPDRTSSLSLLNVFHSSAGYGFSSAAADLRGIRDVSKAQRAGNFSKLSLQQLRAARDLKSMLQEEGLDSISFRFNTTNRDDFIVTEETDIPGDDVLPRSEGPTVLYGELIKIGGRRETTSSLELKVDKKEILTCTIPRENAKELAGYIFQEVMLQGTATWVGSEFELEKFVVQSFQPMGDASPYDTILKLGAVNPEFWKHVDVDSIEKDLK